MRMCVGAGALVLAGLAGVVPAAAGDVYGLVVGIDAYDTLDDLRGAVNDARLLSRTLKEQGAREVVTLIDAQASRAAILDNFQALAASAKPGDWIVFTYAGHGGQEPEAVPGDEADGLDETLLLPAFDPASRAGERLRDNDLYALFKGVKPGVRVLFLADSCHSGTISRPFDPRGAAVSYRQATYGLITLDPLEKPAAETVGRAPDALPHVVVVSAALDTQKAPELFVNGEWHGATSLALAAALGGRADLDGDGATTFGELRSSLVNGVQLKSESRQTPTVAFVPGAERDVLPFSASQTTPPAVELPEFRVLAIGAPLPPIEGAVPAGSQADADFVWDAGTGDLVNARLGDLVATVRTAPELAGAIQKWRALAILRSMAEQHPQGISVGPQGPGAVYAPPDLVDVVVAPRASDDLRYITIFNLSAAGEVQGLFPWDRNPAEAGVIPAGQPVPLVPSLSIVGPSFGAEHIVVVVTSFPPDALRAALRALYQAQDPITGQPLDAQRAAAAVPEVLATHLAQGRHALGIAGLYTRDQRDF